MELNSQSKTTSGQCGECSDDDEEQLQRRVGLIYDERMGKHFAPDGIYRPENPSRIRAIWNMLQSAGIPQRCVVLSAEEAEDEYITSVHTKSHLDLIKNISSDFDSQRDEIAATFRSIYFNEGSSEAASLAVGSVMQVAEKVAKGELDSAVAIIRPPGHHAEEDKPMGFCLYNNVAVATKFLLDESDLGIDKILIVDWDVHHGNGTQKMFWKDPRVLVFSVHRYEFGCFYPASDDGSHIMIGEGPGAGYNVNVPWENGQCGDADYLAAWDYVLIPVAEEFSPDMIIISAGFDAALGDPVGGCRVTPFGYAMMLKKLMEFAEGKIIMALEGGYNLQSLASSVLACMEVLLEDKPISGCIEGPPFDSTWRVIKSVREELSTFWPALTDELPKELPSWKVPPIQFLSFGSDGEDDDGPQILSEDLEDPDSDTEDVNNQCVVSEELEMAVQDVMQPLFTLKIGGAQVRNSTSFAWRSELSNTDVWYAAYGSNMSKTRFLRYIRVGKDKSPPKEMFWMTVHRRLFFGRDRTKTWGPGGVAFLHPRYDFHWTAHVCLYRITLEQFNDVLAQENGFECRRRCPVFNSSDLKSTENRKSMIVKLEGGWYRNVVNLGKRKGAPILAITCTLSDIKKYKSGKLPLCPPAKKYANTLVRALARGNQLSEVEAWDYIKVASNKPL